MKYPESFKFKVKDSWQDIEYLATKIENHSLYMVSWEKDGEYHDIEVRSIDVHGNLALGDWIETKEDI